MGVFPARAQMAEASARRTTRRVARPIARKMAPMAIHANRRARTAAAIIGIAPHGSASVSSAHDAA
jgi:hypothetical protein